MAIYVTINGKFFRIPIVGELPETGLMVISNSGVIAVRVKFIKLFPSVVFSCHQN